MDPALEQYLQKHHISYVLHTHAAAHTVAESHADETIMRIPGLRCKTLFLVDESSRYYLVGMPGVKRLDFKKLQTSLGVKKLTMGSQEALLRETGLVPGSVSIFGVFQNNSIVLVLDEEVWHARQACFHPNVNTETLELTHHALEHFFEMLPNTKKILAL
ncbi:MAG: YbaK/EbsC family protein [Nanoarchaeota archaeon]